MANRIRWNTDPRSQLDCARAVAAELQAGALAILPTETEYALAASCENESAARRLVAAVQRTSRPSIAIVVPRMGDWNLYAPAISDSGQRLIRRCWPGPITLIFPGRPPQSAEPWSDFVRQTLWSDGELALRFPYHDAVRQTGQHLARPLLVATIADHEGAADADAAERLVGSLAKTLIDDGTTRFGRPETVVRVRGESLELVREGVVSFKRVQRLAGKVITFICTGNSCRSPMAEAIFKRMLADRLRCEITELPERGFTVMSAGLAAIPGGPAARAARQVVLDYNANLDDHVSQQLSDELARLSDRLIVMTQEHYDIIRDTWADLESKTALLGGHEDITDPIGESVDRYRLCAAQITRHLEKLLDQLTAV